MSIIATLVLDNKRLNFLHSHFQYNAWQVEQYAYNILSNLCSQYAGGYWHFYELSNGGLYMTPDIQETLTIEVLSNGYQGTGSADAAGIIVTLFSLSALSNLTRQDKFIDAFYHLREFALDHRESPHIFSAID